MTTKTTLRPLTGPEREAARLIAADHPIDLIERETGLTKVKILAARDLSEAWAAVTTNGAGNGHTPKPTVLIGATSPGGGKQRVAPMFQAAKTSPQAGPAPTPKAEHAPSAPEPDPAPDAATAAALDEPPAAVEIDVPVALRGDANRILAEAEKSADPDVLADAQTIRTMLAGLEGKVAISEEERVARIMVDELRKQVAKAEAHLAEVLAAKAPPAPVVAKSPLPEPLALEPADEPDPVKPKSNRGGGDPMAYNETVRTWARRKGMAVGARGRIPMDVVNLFKAEHPAVNA